MAQPAASFQSRSLVRSQPFNTPVTFIGLVAAGGGPTAGLLQFDVSLVVSDRNLLLTSNGIPGAVGPFLDVILFSDQASTLDVLFEVESTTTPRSIMTGAVPMVVAASTLTLVAGLRVVGRYVSINVVNTAGVAANMEVSAILRSV